MDINCRYNRLLKTFYVTCGLTMILTASSFYVLSELYEKLHITNVALETVSYEFKTCKYLYKKALTPYKN